MTAFTHARMHSIKIRLARHIAGLVLAAGLLHFVGSHDLQEWLVPFLFLAGALVAIVAGKPLGWLVAALGLWGSTIIDLVHDYLLWGPHYNWNLGDMLLRQEAELPVIVLFLSAILIIGGLAGWSIGVAVARFRPRDVQS